MASRTVYSTEKIPVSYLGSPTGIPSGVSAIKCGNIVQLFFNLEIQASQEGWYTLGTLIETLRPMLTSNCALYDNSITSFANNNVIDLRIQANGTVEIYVFSDRLSVKPVGSIVYMTKPNNG